VPQSDNPQLEWTRVLLERRYWTSLSVTVMAAFAWALVILGGWDRTSPLWWALALVTGGGGLVWLATFHTLGQVQRRLRGQLQELRCFIPRAAAASRSAPTGARGRAADSSRSTPSGVRGPARARRPAGARGTQLRPAA